MLITETTQEESSVGLLWFVIILVLIPDQHVAKSPDFDHIKFSWQ